MTPVSDAVRGRHGNGGNGGNGGGPDRATRGAVYVEFLIAFLPLFSFFMGLVQLGFVETANLVVKHAAVVGARAAVVVLPDDESEYDGMALNRAEGKRKDAIDRAVKIPLRTLSPFPTPKVTFPTNPGGTDSRVRFGRDDVVRVRVEYDYQCRIPIGRSMVCSFLLHQKKLLGEAALPNQGANYKY